MAIEKKANMLPIKNKTDETIPSDYQLQELLQNHSK